MLSRKVKEMPSVVGVMVVDGGVKFVVKIVEECGGFGWFQGYLCKWDWWRRDIVRDATCFGKVQSELYGGVLVDGV